MHTIDLHLHTHHSDGEYSPAELLQVAASKGMKTLAITDHDNTNGTRAALDLAPDLGIDLIPAIEFTSHWSECDTRLGDRDIDVLGYFVDLQNPEFRAFEEATLADIHQRVAECCACLSAEGYPITLEDVFAENPRYAGVLQLILAMQSLGYAPDWDTAYDLVVPHWHQVRVSNFSIQDVIAHIRDAGGVVMLAHPITVKCSGERLQAEHIARLIEMGLDGLEIYHPRLDTEARAHFLAIARQFDLLVSGGSDLHGWFSGFERLGQQAVTVEMVEALRARHLERT